MPGDRPQPSPRPRPRARPPAQCPRCGSTDTVRIVYGYPTQEAVEAAKRDEIRLGGCLITGHDPTRQCRACGRRFSTRRSPRSFA